MIFNKDSGLVKNVWMPLILSGIYKEAQIPDLGNLRDVVIEVLADLKQ